MKVDPAGEETVEIDMEPADATVFRRSVASINYIALERVDLGHVSKEISKIMARPRVGDELKIKKGYQVFDSIPKDDVY